MKRFLFTLLSVAFVTFLLTACDLSSSVDLGSFENGSSSSINSSSNETDKEEDNSSSETDKEEDSSSSETGGDDKPFWSGFY